MNEGITPDPKWDATTEQGITTDPKAAAQKAGVLGASALPSIQMPPPNAKRLLYAGFFSIVASGVGFSVRAGILPDWMQAYGFTNVELGEITGGGLVGFGCVIILGSLIADRIGYGLLMSLAFLMHFLSAVMVLFSDPIYTAFGRTAVYWNLYISMFMFSIANGLCEVVVNPMTATLFPKQKTHYLNVLHAGWPGGLILGGLVAVFMNNPKIGDWAPGWKVDWRIQMSLFLLPVLIYGAMLVGQRIPRSEASEAGLSLRTMLVQFVSPLLLLLLLIHAMVGYVELGTDSWIGTITGNILGEGSWGRLLFVYTSALMFALRFFAGSFERVLTPLGLLFTCAVIAAAGLLLLGNAVGVLFCLLAVTVYGFGKTFFWPTMLAVASERFPRGGAVVIGCVGGVGMLSAGWLGSPGIGFKQDYYRTAELKEKGKDTYKRYEAEEPNSFLGIFHVRGLDGTKVKALEKSDQPRELEKILEQDKGRLKTWWETSASPHLTEDKKPVEEATLFGSRMALMWTAAVPATMAVLYLLLLGYFKLIGGYKPVVLESGGTDLGTAES